MKNQADGDSHRDKDVRSSGMSSSCTGRKGMGGVVPVAFAVLFAVAGIKSAQAQSVPDGTNLTTVDPAPPAGTVWELEGDAFISGATAITVPAGTGLTIQGTTGGSTITLNNSEAPPVYGHFTIGGGGGTLNLSDVTFTGGQGSSGGVFSGGNLTVNGALIANANTSSSGGGVFSGGTLTINGTLSADANTTTNGAGGVITGGTLLVTGGVSLTNNRATVASGLAAGHSGGAVYLNNASVSLATDEGDVTLRGNIAGAYGGAVYAGGSITIGNNNGLTTLENNLSGFYSDGTLADANGNNSGGGAIFGGATVTLRGSTITLSGNKSASNGGGIMAGGVNGDAIIIEGNLVASRNAAFGDGGFGGAIGTYSGNIKALDSVTLTNNSAGTTEDAGYGGALYTDNGGNVVLATNSGSNALLSGNIASIHGGAIYVPKGSVTIGNAGGTVELSNNFAGYGLIDPDELATLSNIEAVYGQAYGGAILSGKEVTLNGAVTLSGNRAVQNGGAILNLAGDINATGDVTLTDNIAGFDEVVGRGGGLFANNGNVNLATVSGNAVLKGNVASNNGGAILAQGAGVGAVSIGNAAGTVDIQNNAAGYTLIDPTQPRSVSNFDPAALDPNCSLDLSSCATALVDLSDGFDPGSVALPTPVQPLAAPNLTAAYLGNGGAINSVGATTLAGSSVTLSNNLATQHGGGVYAGGAVSIGNSDDSTETISIENNRAGFAANGVTPVNPNASDGGAIRSGGTTTLNGDVITLSGNSATRNGGGIYSVDEVTVTGSEITISNNRAGEGGGIYSTAAVTINGAVTARDNRIGGNGGVIFSSTSVTINNADGETIMTGNRSSTPTSLNGFGGAIAAMDGDVKITGALTLSNNEATYGGAVYVGGEADFIQDGGDVTLTGNRSGGGSGFGGAIYSTGNVSIATTSGSTIRIADNLTDPGAGAGGAINAQRAVTIGNASSTTTLENNKSGTGTGGAISSGNTTTIFGSLIATGNTADRFGGGVIGIAAGGGGDINIATTGGNVTLTGNSVTGGAVGTVSNGGALHATASTFSSVGGNIFIGDAASTIDIQDNTAGFDLDGVTQLNETAKGGALYSDAATTIIGKTITLSNNKAVLDGGGIYTGGAPPVNSMLTITGALTAEGNSAVNGSGGAIYVSNGVTFNLTGTSLISGNTAVDANSGGFLYAGPGSSIVFNMAAGAVATIGDGVASLEGADGIATGAGMGVNLTKQGDGALTLQNLNFISGTTSVTAGTLNLNDGQMYSGEGVLSGGTVKIAGDGLWQTTNTTGAVTNTGNRNFAFTGGTLAITDAGSLEVGNLYSQSAGTQLDLTLVTADRSATTAFITADSVTLAGAINVNMGGMGSGFAKASEVLATPGQLLIDATAGGTSNTITGDFTSKTLGSGSTTGALPDYLYGGIHKTNSNTQVVADVGLSWFGDAATGNGTFTLAATDSFHVDVVLPNFPNNTPATTPYVSGWNGTTLTKEGAGVLILSKANSYTGGTQINGGTLRAGAVNTIPATGLVRVGSAGVLDLAGFNQTVASLTNLGLVNFGADATRTPGTVLTVNGNYVGGGTIALNTVLGGDNSLTDKLVINGGNASGTTALLFTNVGGTGAQTEQGILVVETKGGGTTTPAAFELGSRVTAGSYEYLLERKGENWFLTSETNGGDIFRPEVPAYSLIPALGRDLGLFTMGTLQERVGDQENLRGGEATRSRFNGLWGRALAEYRKMEFSGGASPSVNGGFWGLQLGTDLYRGTTDSGHRNQLGVYGAWGGFASTSARGNALGETDRKVGWLDLMGPSAAAYWTHFGPSGWYVDAVAQGSWYDADAYTFEGTRIRTRAEGVTASVEAGYPMAMGESGIWAVEPQVEVVYQDFGVPDSRDALSAVSWAVDQAWTGRLGVRLLETRRPGGEIWQRYGHLNLWHEFSGADGISFDGNEMIETRFGGTMLEFGGGLTAKAFQRASFYLDGSYRHSVGGGRRDSSGIFGTVGLRLNW